MRKSVLTSEEGVVVGMVPPPLVLPDFHCNSTSSSGVHALGKKSKPLWVSKSESRSGKTCSIVEIQRSLHYLSLCCHWRDSLAFTPSPAAVFLHSCSYMSVLLAEGFSAVRISRVTLTFMEYRTNRAVLHLVLKCLTALTLFLTAKS